MKTELLKTNPMFSSIPDRDLEELIDKRHIFQKHHSKGATAHNAKGICDTMDIVLSGCLMAYALSFNGSTTRMFEFKKGDIIGANLLFGENRSYPFNIYCMTDCEILHVDLTAVSELLHDYDFTLYFIRSISQNSQGVNQKIAMFMQKTLRENIMDYLMQQRIVQNSSAIQLPMSKKQLADYFGIQRPSLFRELKKLKDEGIIDINNRTITILCIAQS